MNERSEGGKFRHNLEFFKNNIIIRGAWVAQSVERLTSAQVMISRSVSLSPASGSVLTAQSLEPALDSGSPSPSAPPPTQALSLSLSLSVKKKNNNKH